MACSCNKTSDDICPEPETVTKNIRYEVIATKGVAFRAMYPSGYGSLVIKDFIGGETWVLDTTSTEEVQSFTVVLHDTTVVNCNVDISIKLLIGNNAHYKNTSDECYNHIIAM